MDADEFALVLELLGQVLAEDPGPMWADVEPEAVEVECDGVGVPAMLRWRERRVVLALGAVAIS